MLAWWPPVAFPATKDLGLERVGVETDRRGFIPVNEQLQVVRDGEPVPHLWAIGRCPPAK